MPRRQIKRDGFGLKTGRNPIDPEDTCPAFDFPTHARPRPPRGPRPHLKTAPLDLVALRPLVQDPPVSVRRRISPPPYHRASKTPVASADPSGISRTTRPRFGVVGPQSCPPESTCGSNTGPLPADASRIGDVLFEALKSHVLRDDAVGRRKAPAAPDPTSPAKLAPCETIDPSSYAPGRRRLRRHRHEHMDVIAGQRAADTLKLYGVDQTR